MTSEIVVLGKCETYQSDAKRIKGGEYKPHATSSLTRALTVSANTKTSLPTLSTEVKP